MGNPHESIDTAMVDNTQSGSEGAIVPTEVHLLYGDGILVDNDLAIFYHRNTSPKRGGKKLEFFFRRGDSVKFEKQKGDDFASQIPVNQTIDRSIVGVHQSVIGISVNDHKITHKSAVVFDPNSDRVEDGIILFISSSRPVVVRNVAHQNSLDIITRELAVRNGNLPSTSS